MAQPADLGERVFPPDLVEDKDYYVYNLSPYKFSRIHVWGVRPRENGKISITYQTPGFYLHEQYPGHLDLEPDFPHIHFYKIQGVDYTPPTRNYLGNEVAPKNLQVGRNYYVRSNGGPFRRQTIKNVSPHHIPEMLMIKTQPSNVFPQGQQLGTRQNIDPKIGHKFYKAQEHMYKENAARKLIEPMLTYSSRPPGTMGPENEGGRVYKLWERKFQANRGSRRRRSKRRATRRKN